MCSQNCQKTYCLLIKSHHLVIAITSIYFDYVCFSCPNLSENRKRNLWKGHFEGMKHHLHLPNRDMMLVGDIQIKWLGFNTVLLDLVEKPALLLGRSNDYQGILLQYKSRRKSCIKQFVLKRSQEDWTCYKNHGRLYPRSLRRSCAVYEQNVIMSAVGILKVFCRYIREGKSIIMA